MIEARRALNTAFKMNNEGQIDKLIILIADKNGDIQIARAGHMSKIEAIGMCYVGIDHISNGGN